jgi:hypothetical protein
MPVKSLREFLQEKAKDRPDHEERNQRLQEWRGAVQQLLDQLQTWLREADPDGLLAFHSWEASAAEPSLGRYTVPVLLVKFFDDEVTIKPVARNAVGFVETGQGDRTRAAGRVDLIGRDGIDKYILYRVPVQGEYRWYLLDERFEAAPLDQPRFEAAMRDLLS